MGATPEQYRHPKVAAIEVQRVGLPAWRPLALADNDQFTRPAVAGWSAKITLIDGSRVIADRIDGEATWQVNGVYQPGKSFPVFWNGHLSRCTITPSLHTLMAFAPDGLLVVEDVVAATEREAVQS